MAWEVRFYQNSRGDEPVKIFISDLDARTREKVYELRVKSKVAVRIFYSSKTRIYYLLHAFEKKSQKTPEKELKVAIDRLRELL
jgi:phage-related protein